MTQKMTHLRREVHHVVYRPGESNLAGISINSFHTPQTQERERESLLTRQIDSAKRTYRWW